MSAFSSDRDDRDAAFAHCADAVRNGDHERWLTTLFAPAAARADLLALYAFNLELARTAEAVSEPMLGQIRLQWWREAVAEIGSGQPRRHPVVLALADLHRRRPLSAADLAALIDARETDLTPEPFDDEAAFLAYAEATSAPLVRLALAVLNAPMAHDRSVGLGYAITGLVRAAPYWARERRLALPRDLLAAEALTAEDVYRRRQRPVLAKVVAQLADRARLALDEVGRPDRAALPALLPAALARLHLARLARAGHDPFTLAERPPPALATPLRLIWAKWTGRL